MPANLNALIRYKTIDSCLSNPHRKWRIRDLVEACSEALRADRGTGAGVSERTVREDIRIMRSDILGFNAPIVQKWGYYKYNDPTYSIFGVSVHGRDLLSRILDFILDIRGDIDHPGMESIIRNLEEVLEQEKQEDISSKPITHPSGTPSRKKAKKEQVTKPRFTVEGLKAADFDQEESMEPGPMESLDEETLLYEPYPYKPVAPLTFQWSAFLELI